MGIVAQLARGLRPNARLIPEDPYRQTNGYPYLPVGLLPAGVHLTMESALQLSAVWACIDAVAKAIAACKWMVYTRDTAGRRVPMPDDTAVYLLNVRPNSDMTAIGFREAMLYAALSYGNGYAEIVRDGAGRISELWPLQPDRMQPRRTNAPPYSLYYEYQQEDGGTVNLRPSQVFHLHGPGVSGLMGDNIISRAAKTMALAAASETFSATYFGNNTVIGGVLEYPKALSKEAFDRLRDSWVEKHQGPNRAHKPAILENGMKWVPIQTDAEKAQMVEARKFQLEEICRFFGVPLHKIQHIDRATFNNIEHLGIEFVRDALTPWGLRCEQEADFKLFQSRGGPQRFTKLDMAWLSYGDAKSRAEYYQIMRRIGVYSANEIREKEGDNHLSEDDGGDVRIVESNMQTLENLLLQEEQAEQAPGETADDDESLNEMAMPAGEESDVGAEPAFDYRQQAVMAMLQQALGRYGRRIANREKDIKRPLTPDERAKHRPWFLDECSYIEKYMLGAYRESMGAPAMGKQCLIDALDKVDGGASPAAVAADVVRTVYGG